MSDTPLVIFPPIATDPADLDPVQLDRVNPPPSITVHCYPGHGGTARRPGVTFRDLADEVADRIAAGPDGVADIVGIGMGAYVLTEFLLHHPERVRSGIVISSPLGTIPDEWRELDRAVGRSALGGMSSIVEPTLARWLTPWALETDMPGVRTARQRLKNLDPDAWNDYWLAIAARSTLDAEAAAAVRQPITVVAPLHDPSPNLRRLRELCDSLPLSRLMYVDGPHMVHVERPENVLAAIDSHLAWSSASPQPVQGLYWVGR